MIDGYNIKGIALILLLLTLCPIVSAQVEYAPGERLQEALFNLGMARPWLISEHFPWQYGCTTLPCGGPVDCYVYFGPHGGRLAEFCTFLRPNYPCQVNVPLRESAFLGYLNAGSGTIRLMDAIAADPQGIVNIHVNPGSYPVFAILDPQGYLSGVYVDVANSRPPQQPL